MLSKSAQAQQFRVDDCVNWPLQEAAKAGTAKPDLEIESAETQSRTVPCWTQRNTIFPGHLENPPLRTTILRMLVPVPRMQTPRQAAQ